MTLKVGMAKVALRIGSALPFAVLHALARPIAALARLLGTREARVAKRNIELVFPELSVEAKHQLWRESLRQTAMSLTELPRVWVRPEAALSEVQSVEGAALLEAAIERGQGVLIAAPHLGSWELLNLWLSRQAPMAILYRVPQRAEFDALMRSLRGHFGAEPVRADAAGVRTLFRRLKAGRMVGILPDQRPKSGEGTWGIFFGQRAKTMTLFGRLAHKSGAPVLLAWAERLPSSGGFTIHIEALGAAASDADPVVATDALNLAIERAARRVPAQYQWTYKRFGMREHADDALPY